MALAIVALIGVGCGQKPKPPVTSKYSQAIFEAIEKNDLAKVEELIKKDPAVASAPAGPNHGLASISEGDTPLHFASHDVDTLEILRTLIKAKADISATNEDGEQPLHDAGWWDQPGAARELLSAKADPNAKDNMGRTPLHSLSDHEPFENALGERDRRTKTGAVLLSGGADVDARDESGMTPLHIAAMHHHIGLVELYIAEGADVNARTTAPTKLVSMFLDGSTSERQFPSRSTPLGLADDAKTKAILRKHGGK